MSSTAPEPATPGRVPIERQAVERKVIALLAEALRREPAEIGLDDRLQEDLGAASIDMMTLLFELEDTFGREITDQELARLTTVRSVVELVHAEGGGEGGAP